MTQRRHWLRRCSDCRSPQDRDPYITAAAFCALLVALGLLLLSLWPPPPDPVTPPPPGPTATPQPTPDIVTVFVDYTPVGWDPSTYVTATPTASPVPTATERPEAILTPAPSPTATTTSTPTPEPTATPAVTAVQRG